MGSGKKNQILTEKPYDSFWATLNEKVILVENSPPTFGGFGVKQSAKRFLKTLEHRWTV